MQGIEKSTHEAREESGSEKESLKRRSLMTWGKRYSKRSSHVSVKMHLKVAWAFLSTHPMFHINSSLLAHKQVNSRFTHEKDIFKRRNCSWGAQMAQLQLQILIHSLSIQPHPIISTNKIKGVKLNVPPFKGRSDPDAYLDWEMKIQHVFSCNDYTEEQEVKFSSS